MKRLQTKWASLTIILTLLISLLPTMTAYASATLTISNLYTQTSNAGTASELPLDDASVTRVTTLPFALYVDITGVTETQINSLYYVVTNLNSGSIKTEKNNKAQKASANQVFFNNVNLEEGLNKIVVMLGDTDTYSSAPGWIYYAPTTNLSGFTVNTANWSDNTMYPTDRTALKAGSTGIQISAKAPNATQVEGTMLGDTIAKDGFISSDGNVYFTGDDKTKTNATCSSTTNFCFTPGDNQITFVASNDTNKYSVTKKIWYDNGGPFAFNGQIAQTSATPVYQDLITVPTFENTNLTVKLSLKSDYYAGTTVTKYTYADIAIDGQSIANNILFSASDASAVVTNGSTTATLNKNSSLTKSGEYAVSDLTLDTNIAGLTLAANPQNLTVTFKDNTGTLPDVSTTYNFKYVDATKPYINYTALKSNSGVESQLSLSDTNEISELPAQLVVYANKNTATLRVDVDGSAYTSDSATATINAFNARTPDSDSTADVNKFTITLQGLADGAKNVRLTPFDSGGSAYNAAITDYTINISNAPYITVSNISNNMTIKNITSLQCGLSTSEPCISGRAINFYKDGAGNKIEVYINEKSFTLDSNTADAIFDDNNQFKIPLNASTFGALPSGFVEGLNTLKFRVYLGGSFITQQTYNIYYFTTEAPEFTSIKPVETGTTGATQYVPASTAGTYTTTERTVSFKGVFSSLTSSGDPTMKSLSIYVHTKDANGNALVLHQTVNSSGVISDQDPSSTLALSTGTSFVAGVVASSTPQSFTTGAFKLLENSDVVFEFRITNNSNITATKSITITRANVPYTIVQPILITNSSGDMQANINKNYFTVKINAENADSVVIGKDTATKTTVSDSTGDYDQYVYTVKNLKAGANTIKFTVTRGSNKSSGTFILYNANTDVQGAGYMTDMSTKLKAFNGKIQLNFPSNTKLMRNKPDSNNNQYITNDRQVLFGLADSTDGRLDKTTYTTNSYYKSLITQKITENTFGPASELYYLDAGFIPDATSTTTTTADLLAGLTGAGMDPYDASKSGRAYFTRNYDELVVPTNPGTLTLAFNSALRMDAGKYVTVFFYDIYPNYYSQTDRGWKNLGGVVDTSKNTITVPFQKFGYYQVMYMDKSFDDITGHAYARNELETLYSKGVMKASTTYSFIPDNAITRGEFAEMLVKMFKIPLDYEGDSTFSDVLKMDYGLYEYKYIETAARAGIIRGQASNRFNPSGSITRQDAAIMIARAGNLKLGTDPAKSLTSLSKSFTDGADIDYYARTAVEAIVKAGYIEGIANTVANGTKATYRFDPTELLTRAQGSVIAYRVMKKSKMVP
ncbi:S-layer homology domain-containing protein [Paenibacillus hexagrammi]|uniref:S-layer homology domain-containing protein n=1 Tax=Paenibacillus hexagrammi TaxID=2908839 RepID=A0ABY3SH36_9BACL|nr:S-layer homology domain-containing protein [Paenibacillus sp. YPD9-1]UJF33251.1 S-layer homology domain-containing protein [Paenibacillus sp. YPD9-1]